MSDSILKDNTTTEDLVHDLALISLKIAQFTSRMEVWLGDDFLPPKYKLELYQMYQIANRHFKSDDPDSGKLYDDKELASIQEQADKA
jgi:hypothetical protein